MTFTVAFPAPASSLRYLSWTIECIGWTHNHVRRRRDDSRTSRAALKEYGTFLDDDASSDSGTRTIGMPIHFVEGARRTGHMKVSYTLLASSTAFESRSRVVLSTASSTDSTTSPPTVPAADYTLGRPRPKKSDGTTTTATEAKKSFPCKE